VNNVGAHHSGENHAFPPFFEFGTAHANYAISRMTRGQLGREYQMTVNLNNALAAVAALTLSVLCMATAIVPAMPAGLLA
jgi:hypothetical protein